MSDLYDHDLMTLEAPQIDWPSDETPRWERHKPVTREKRFGRIRLNDVWKRKIKAVDWIVDNWMAPGEVSFFAGESEAGKTFLAIDCAMRVALGMKFLGRRVRQGLVIYQIGESPNSLIDLRLPAWRSYYGDEVEDPQQLEEIPFELLTHPINIRSTDDRDKQGVIEFLSCINSIAAEHPTQRLALIVIDTWSQAFAGGSELDDKETARAVSNAQMIARETGAHVTIIHHFPKGSQTLRGHGLLKANVHAVAMLKTTHDKIRHLSFDKLRDGVKKEERFRLPQVNLGYRDDDGEPITSCVIEHIGENEEPADLSVPLNGTERLLLQCIFDATDTHGIDAPSALNLSKTVRVVAYGEAKALFYKRNPNDDLDSPLSEEMKIEVSERHNATVRQRLSRARGHMTHTSKTIMLDKCKDPATGKETQWVWWSGRHVRGFKRTQPPKPRRDDIPEEIQHDFEDIQAF